VDGGLRHRHRDGDRRATLAVAFDTVGVSEPDERLVRRFQEGSSEAFEALVQRHGTRVYNLCLRILGDAEEAADASQDTFLAALRKLSTFRGDAAFTTWLHRVAVNACYDSLRKKRRRPLLQLAPEEGDERPEPSLPAPDHADGVVFSVDVAEALRQVPEEFRVVLVLADVQDLPYDEIAAVLDIPVGTVKSRVFRGRAALGRALGVACGEPSRASRTSEEEA
jgi:RNA polymerase sigma-70 factor, ECF subfamily